LGGASYRWNLTAHDISFDGTMTGTLPSHNHAGENITSGTVADARIAGTLLRGPSGASAAVGNFQLSSGTGSQATGLSSITGCSVTLYYGTMPVAQTLSYGKSGGTITVFSSDTGSAYWVSYVCIGT
jgi:hypothetical protein